MDKDTRKQYDEFLQEYGNHIPVLFLKPHFFEKNDNQTQVMNHSKSEPHNAGTYYVHDPINVISKVVNYEDLSQDT